MADTVTMVGVGDVSLAVHEWGQGDTLMLLHGLGGDGGLWKKQVADFSPSYRMIAPDLRGFGRSDKPRDPASYRIEALARDVVALIEALHLSAVHLLGTSMGGFIAQTVALSRPNLCRSLVLCHTAAQMSIPADILDARREALERSSMMEIAGMLVQQAIAPESLPRLRDDVIAMAAGNDKWVYTQVLTKALAAVDLRHCVAEIRVPTMVLVGALDRVIPPDHGRDLARRIPGAQFASVAKAGHLSYLEQPGAFNRAVLGFLASL